MNITDSHIMPIALYQAEQQELAYAMNENLKLVAELKRVYTLVRYHSSRANAAEKDVETQLNEIEELLQILTIANPILQNMGQTTLAARIDYVINKEV